MRLIDLQGIVCDTVELNWQDDGRCVIKEFDDCGDGLEPMYELYGDAVITSIYALCDDQENSWLCIHIEKPKIRIKDPRELYINKYTGNNSKGIPMETRYSLKVDAKVIPYLLENMDCEISTFTKFQNGHVVQEISNLHYDGSQKD